MNWSFFQYVVLFLIAALLTFSCGDSLKEIAEGIDLSLDISTKKVSLRSDVSAKAEVQLYHKLKYDTVNLYKVDVSVFPFGISSVSRVEVRVDLDGFSDQTVFFVPGVWIWGNKFSLTKAYSPEKGNLWIFREDRLPVPLVLAFDKGKVFAVLKIPAKFDYSVDPELYKAGDNAIYSTDIAGLGFDARSKQIIINLPAYEYPLIYRRKILNPYTLSPIDTFAVFDSERKISFFVLKFSARDFSEAVEQAWKISFDIYDKEGIIPAVNHQIQKVEEVLLSLKEYFKKYFVDDFVSGFYSFVETETGKVVTNFIESSFTGMSVFNGNNSIFIGKKFGDVELVQRGVKVINSWIDNAREGEFFWDCFDTSTKKACNFPPFFYRDSFFTRRNFETLLAVYLAYREIGDKRWLNEFLEGVSAMIALQNEDGSFSRRYSFSGRKIESEPSGSYFAVPVLIKAYEETGFSDYLRSALRVGRFLVDLAEKYEYFGSTLDANSEDKEASMWTFISCYLLFKSSYIPEDERQIYKDCARRSLYSSLSWFFIWNVPFSPNQKFYKIGLKTLGLSLVSVENVHVDVYLFFFPKMIFDFADFLDEKDRSRIKRMADIVMLSAMEVVPTLRDTKGSVLGIVPEVIHQTWWDYGVGGKGSYNITSATGWTVASLVSAIKNYFYSPDF